MHALPEQCKLRWTSPTAYVLAGMYEYMFRCAVAATSTSSSTPGSDSNSSSSETQTQTQTQTFTVQRTSRDLVFKVHTGFLAGSLTVLGCGVVFLCVLMLKWWLLGRQVTLSPLETAGALGRSVVAGRPEMGIMEILSVVDEEVVRREGVVKETKMEKGGLVKGVEVDMVEVSGK